MEEPRPNNPKDELIAKIMKKNLRLSYSTLKNFTTPIDFINYKLKPKEQSPSMAFGSLCDLLLLTPDELDNRFAILDKVPTSDNQISFSNALIAIAKTKKDGELSEEIIRTEFPKHYKVGDPIKTYNLLSDYIDAKVKGLEIVDSKTLEEAREITDNLIVQPEIQDIFSNIQDVQKKIKWVDSGWEFIGFMDILTQDHIYDLKFSRDSDPEKFERDILNYDYHLQGAMYCYAAHLLGICDQPRYSFIVYDKSGNFSIIELDYGFLRYGERKYKYLLQELERCISECAFDMSYSFFKKTYTAYKPKWAKAFLLDDDEEN